MKFQRLNLHPHFVSDKQGNSVGVFLDLPEYESLLKRLEDLALGALATDIKKHEKGTVSLEEVKKSLQRKKPKAKK